MAWNVYSDPQNYQPGEWAEVGSVQTWPTVDSNLQNYQPGEWADVDAVQAWPTVASNPVSDPLGEELVRAQWTRDVYNQDPAPSDIFVARDQTIHFDVVADADIVLETVVIKVEGEIAYQGSTDVFVAPYNSGSTRTPITGGQQFDIIKDVFWPSSGTVSVEITATDGLGKTLDVLYSFSIETYGCPRAVFYDGFDVGTIAEQFEGNGSFNFPGGAAELICPNSQNCDWDYNSGPYAPVLWTSEGVRSERAMPQVYEAKMDSFIRTTNLALAGLTVFPEIGLPQSFFYMAYYANESRIIIDRQYGTGATRLYNSSTGVPDPATTPHIYRIYSNKSDKALYVPETDTVLGPNSIGFAFSTDDGASWTMAHTRTIDIYYFRVGIFCRKWATGGGDNATATFDYLSVKQYCEEKQAVDPLVGSASFEEQIEFPPVGGDPRGPLDLEYGLVSPLKGAAFDEEIELLPTGGTPRHQVLGLDPGEVRRPVATSFEEQIDLELFDGPDYMQYKDDSDGTEFLQGRQTRALLAVDLTSELWNTHGADFYGTARNGKNYYDGEECTPTGPEGTSFGTVAGGPNRRCWSLWHKAAPMDYSSSVPLITASIPSDGVVRFVGTALASQGGYVMTMWYLDGDFDIQVQWDNWSESGGTDGGGTLAAYADNDNLFYCRRRISGGVAENGRLDKDVKVNGSYGNYSFVNAAGVTSGWMRLVRSGNLVSSYYGSPGSWTQIGSSVDMGRAEPMFVAASIWGTGTPNMSVDFSNFSINSGTVINTAAWAREAKGTHRGNADEFPLKPLFVATDNTLEIIDPTTDLVWMRFLEGTSNPLNPNWSGTEQWVHDLAFSQGVLLLAYHGALVRIDFNLSDIRIGRLLTDTNRGAVYLNSHGNAYAGWSNMASPTNAHINNRNAGRAFSTPSYDAWQIDSRDVNSVDLMHVSGYEYRAIATAAGLRMQKWRRWYLNGVDDEGITTPDWSEWDTANDVKWCRIEKTTGELFWMDDTNMYSAPQGGGSGWEDRMDESTFSAVTTKALPGTREWFTRWMFVKHGDYLFTPADEGIYRVNWPSGSWELFYGNAASAATHKILPNYSYPTCLALGADGTTPVLVVGMLDGVTVVDLDADALHSNTPVKTGQYTQVVAL